MPEIAQKSAESSTACTGFDSSRLCRFILVKRKSTVTMAAFQLISRIKDYLDVGGTQRAITWETSVLVSVEDGNSRIGLKGYLTVPLICDCSRKPSLVQRYGRIMINAPATSAPMSPRLKSAWFDMPVDFGPTIILIRMMVDQHVVALRMNRWAVPNIVLRPKWRSMFWGSQRES